jgi:hypothetical protein
MHLGSHRKFPLEFYPSPPSGATVCPIQIQSENHHKIPGFPWVYSFFGLESLLRENEGELKYLLLAKRCAPRAHRLWPEAAILVRRGSPPERNGASSRGLA